MQDRERIQFLMSKARHPSCTAEQRLAIRTEIQLLQNKLLTSKGQEMIIIRPED